MKFGSCESDNCITTSIILLALISTFLKRREEKYTAAEDH